MEPTVEISQDAEFASIARPQASGMTGWVMRHSGGYIQDERNAQYVLLGFVAAAAIAAFLALNAGTPPGAKGPIPAGTSETVPG